MLQKCRDAIMLTPYSNINWSYIAHIYIQESFEIVVHIRSRRISSFFYHFFGLYPLQNTWRCMYDNQCTMMIQYHALENLSITCTISPWYSMHVGVLFVHYIQLPSMRMNTSMWQPHMQVPLEYITSICTYLYNICILDPPVCIYHYLCVNEYLFIS